MPKQWFTFRTEYDYRHANVPYWSGPGGITPPAGIGLVGTNNGSPTQFACMNGSVAVNGVCGSGTGGIWRPDLRKSEALIDIDLMVKF
jgi:hypothetical protein